MTSFHHQNLIKMQSDLYQRPRGVVHLCGCSALEASANFNYTPSQLCTLHKINIQHACMYTYIGTRVEILYRARWRLQNYNSSKNNNSRATSAAAAAAVPTVCSLFIGTFCWCSNSLVRAHTRMQIAEEPCAVRCAAR